MSTRRSLQWRAWLEPLAALSSNWISAAGVVLLTTSALVWLFTLVADASHEQSNPYIGILLFLIAPGVFFFGLALVPLGMWIRRRNPSWASDGPFSLSNPRIVRLLIFIGGMTVLNVVLAGSFTYQAVEYMDSRSFCGATCHTVMSPEYTAYSNSPHANVECVKCHIGPGASWFVKSKLSGARQLYAVAFNTHSRPIQTPVEDLRPSRDTCEACHWPARFSGERLRVIWKYADDEQNTRQATVLMMHIGGGMTSRGIHGAHVGAGVQIRYAHEDRERQKVAWTEVERPGKETLRYIRKGGENASGAVRTMDCIDCHNRPTHIFESAQTAVNRLFQTGDLSTELPFLKKQAMLVLEKPYASREEAVREVPGQIEAFYREKYGDIYKAKASLVKTNAKAVLSAYERNVFPEMKITWGTYINNIGHTEFPGCFRCHDGEHTTKSGQSISQDCSTCHEMLAMEEADPKILKDLGAIK
jgi:hypothetical protein